MNTKHAPLWWIIVRTLCSPYSHPYGEVLFVPLWKQLTDRLTASETRTRITEASWTTEVRRLTPRLTWTKKAMAQLSVVYPSVCLDLKCNETLWLVSVFTLGMPCIVACVWVLDDLKRCTQLSVMKCDWEALSNNALHGTYWPILFWTSTIAWQVEFDFWVCP